MRFTLRTLVFVLVLGIAVALPATAFAGVAFIRGVVRDTDDHALSGIAVSAWREPMSEGESIAQTTQTVTAADGSYELTITQPGWYAVAYDDPTDTFRDQSFFRTGLPIDWAPAIYMEDSEEATGVDVWMTPLSWLSSHRAVRVAGNVRYDTAIAVSQTNFVHAPTVVLATGAGFADACAAAPLCGAYRAPLLLTSRYSLPAGLIDELRRLGTTQVLVVGSNKVVDESVLGALRSEEITVTRIWGDDRYQTAAAITRHLMREGVEMQAEPFVVRGDNFPDALAVSPFAYAQVRPVLLVKPTSAPSPTVDVLAELGADTVYVVGSEAAVSEDALEELAAGAPDDMLYYGRIWGDDRYGTALAVVEAWDWPYDNLGIATGLDFPDALTGGIACGENWGGLLLSRPGGLDSGATALIAGNGEYLWPVQLYGGTKVLSDTVLSQAAFAAGSSFLEFEDDGFGLTGLRKPFSAGRASGSETGTNAVRNTTPDVTISTVKGSARQ